MPSANKADYDRARAAQSEREAASKGGIGGFLSGIFGGGKAPATKSDGPAPTSSPRPMAKPGVVKTGTGKDQKFMDTRTGKSYAAPSYGALSFRGLTSTDPANVARNQYGRERLDAMRAGMGDRGGPDRSGIASLHPAPTPTPLPVDGTAAAPAVPATPPTAAELAMIGAPTSPMAPIFVDPPVYGTEMPQGMPGMMGYGSAFANAPGAPQLTQMDLIDLFGPYMNFGR